MRTRWEVDRQFAAQALALKAEVPADLMPQHSAAEAGSWLAATVPSPDASPDDARDMLCRDVPCIPAERTGAGPVPGMSPMEILRDLQERRAASVITAAMPGPQAWGL